MEAGEFMIAVCGSLAIGAALIRCLRLGEASTGTPQGRPGTRTLGLLDAGPWGS